MTGSVEISRKPGGPELETLMAGWGFGMDAGAWIWMLVWVSALIAMVWLIVRSDHQPRADDPEAILRARFARGEINAEEFERAQLVLHQETGSNR